jgi:hypothetical protein
MAFHRGRACERSATRLPGAAALTVQAFKKNSNADPDLPRHIQAAEPSSRPDQADS